MTHDFEQLTTFDDSQSVATNKTTLNTYTGVLNITPITEDLVHAGYRKMNGHFKGETFGFWKSIGQGQIAVLFYDRSTYLKESGYSIQYEFFFGKEDERIDLSISHLKFNVFDLEEMYWGVSRAIDIQLQR